MYCLCLYYTNHFLISWQPRHFNSCKLAVIFSLTRKIPFGNYSGKFHKKEIKTKKKNTFPLFCLLKSKTESTSTSLFQFIINNTKEFFQLDTSNAWFFLTVSINPKFCLWCCCLCVLFSQNHCALFCPKVLHISLWQEKSIRSLYNFSNLWFVPTYTKKIKVAHSLCLLYKIANTLPHDFTIRWFFFQKYANSIRFRWTHVAK